MSSSKKIKRTPSVMDTNEKLIRYWARYVKARSGLELDDIFQELRVETWQAGRDWHPQKGDPSWNMFLTQRLQWKASKMIRSVARKLTVEKAFQQQHTGDFYSPSHTLCNLSYELSRSLTTNEAKKVFSVMQVPTELIAPDCKGDCPSAGQMASYLGIAELSVTRGLREIKRHLRALLDGEQQQQ